MDPTAPGRRRSGRTAVGRPARHLPVALGHTVEEIDPIPGLPDMVFAANGATVIDGIVVRRPVPLPGACRRGTGLPELARRRRLRDARGEAGQRGRGRPAADRAVPARRHRVPHRPRRPRRGPGALRPAGDHPAAGRPALLPPRHRADRARRRRGRLPTRRRSRPRAARVLAQLFPDAIVASVADAAVLGLNAVSDGRHVVMPVQATGLAAQFAERGYDAGPGRPVRAVEGRRRTEVLHAGAEGRMSSMTTNRTADADRRGRALDRAQLPPAAGGHRRGRRRLGDRCGR